MTDYVKTTEQHAILQMQGIHLPLNIPTRVEDHKFTSELPDKLIRFTNLTKKTSVRSDPHQFVF